MGTIEMNCPPVSLFGKGCIARLPELIAGNYKKALVVTDKGVAGLGLHKKLTDILDEIGLKWVLYSGVRPNPTVQNVNEAFALFCGEACDIVFSVGGGSAIDCAKGVSILGANGGDILSYLRDGKKPDGAVTHVAIATTSGTGSEASHSYVISDDAVQIKYGVRHRLALPAIAVNDTDMLFGLPRGLTASTGMDALTHAVEALIGVSQSHITYEMALSAIKLVFGYLPAACEEPQNELARDKMAAAQFLAGIAFGNTNVGLVHCMSHQLSAVYDIPHGAANAALLPHCLRFEKKGCIPALCDIADMLWPLETSELGAQEKADYTIEQVAALSHRVGTDISLAQLLVRREDFALLAQKTLQDGSIDNSAVFPTEAEVQEIFSAAF